MKWLHTLKNQISYTNQVKDDLAILKSNYHLIKLVWGHRELSPSDKNGLSGNSLAVQWLRLCTFTAEDLSSVSGCGTRIPQAEWHSQKKKKRISCTTAFTIRLISWTKKLNISCLTSSLSCCWFSFRWNKQKGEFLIHICQLKQFENKN